MNKLIIAAVLSLTTLVTATFADEVDDKIRKKEMRERRERFLRANGGRIIKPGTPLGKIRFVTSVKDVDAAVLDKLYAQFKKAYPFDIQTVVGQPVTVETAAAAKAKQGFALVVYIVDSPLSAPMIAAPEEGWAFVNRRVCGTPERTAKEAVKAFAFIAGAANSSYGVSFLSSTRPEEFDSISSITFPFDVSESIKKQLALINVIPEINVTYRQAVQEGWAPAPTNEYQKAVWEKVHAPPEKPIKITYDKDREKPVVK